MIPYFRCWLCWGVINPKGSVFNLDLYSLFLVNNELLSHNNNNNNNKNSKNNTNKKNNNSILMCLATSTASYQAEPPPTPQNCPQCRFQDPM